MSKDEIKGIHDRHKREVTRSSIDHLKKKDDFEVNSEEDSDEDFAGPKIELF
jgi:hypothetical protein